MLLLTLILSQDNCLKMLTEYWHFLFNACNACIDVFYFISFTHYYCYFLLSLNLCLYFSVVNYLFSCMSGRRGMSDNLNKRIWMNEWLKLALCYVAASGEWDLSRVVGLVSVKAFPVRCNKNDITYKFYGLWLLAINVSIHNHLCRVSTVATPMREHSVTCSSSTENAMSPTDKNNFAARITIKDVVISMFITVDLRNGCWLYNISTVHVCTL